MIRLEALGPFSFAAGAAAGKWILVANELGARTIDVRSGPFVVGRALDCDLRLPHSEEMAKSTSRWHCHISSGGTEHRITDGSLHPMPETGKVKASVGGTLVDGARIDSPTALRPGMTISVGPWRFGVRGPAGPRVDIDVVLKSVFAQPPHEEGGAGPGAVQAFAQLHGLFRRIEKVGDVQEGLQAVLEHALAHVKCAVVAAILEEAPNGEVTVRSALHKEHGLLQDFRFSSSLLKELPSDRSVILAGPAGPAASRVGEKISSGLVVPLKSREGRMGFLYLDNRGGAGVFSKADLHFGYALANVASLQMSLERQAFLARLEQNMTQYFGPDVVRLIVRASREGKPLGLGVKDCEAAVLFVDIKGFSPFCRDRSPEDVAVLLGPYYKLVADCVHANGGHVDKFLGDGVMAVFGVSPLRSGREPVENHSLQAARCARQIMRAWGEGSLSQWGMRLSLRAGLHVGRVVAGNIGFVGRMEFGVIGDAVNLAARVEKFARPNAAALTDQARGMVSGEFACEDGGLNDVHGFGKVRIWHLA